MSLPSSNDEPTGQPGSTQGVRIADAPVSAGSGSSSSDRGGAPEATVGEPRQTSPAPPASDPPPGRRRTSRGATAYDPDSGSDDEPPQPVPEITPSKITSERLTLSWPAARDNVRVVGYHVWLSGFEVADTTQTHATVRWFNDDTRQHIVQVKAVDAAGNEAETSPSLLVSRPDPGETPTPEPDAPTEQPTPDPTPEATQSTADASSSPKLAANEVTSQAVRTPAGQH